MASRRKQKAQTPIRIKKENKGLLHKNLGVDPGKKISSGTLKKAKKSKNISSAEKKRIVFAENAKKWNKPKKKKA